MSYTTVVGSTTTLTTVDCHKQVRSWRLLRSLLELLIPTCHCAFIEENHETKQQTFTHTYYCPRRTWVSTTTITGTIFGHRHGKVYFCIQTNPKSTNPVLLLELSIPTTILAREMRSGILRIALESTARANYQEFSSLLSMPVWTMYCNGKKVGFAFRINPSKADVGILEIMESVSTGAGILSGKEIPCGDEIMYLRGNFESVCRSSNSNSFHLIDPEGNIGQELSIFFLRS